MLLEELYSPGKRVIDIGCGLGRLTQVFAARFESVLAIDVNAGRVEQLRARLREQQVTNVTVQVLDARQLPFPDGAFHVAIFGGSLDHIAEYPRALQEAHRVLSSGGALYVSLREAGPATAAVAALEALRELADELLTRMGTGDGQCDVRPISRDELLPELARAGFRDVRVAVTPAGLEESLEHLDHLRVRIEPLLATASQALPELHQALSGRFRSALAAAQRDGARLRGRMEVVATASNRHP